MYDRAVSISFDRMLNSRVSHRKSHDNVLFYGIILKNGNHERAGELTRFLRFLVDWLR